MRYPLALGLAIERSSCQWCCLWQNKLEATSHGGHGTRTMSTFRLPDGMCPALKNAQSCCKPKVADCVLLRPIMWDASGKKARMVCVPETKRGVQRCSRLCIPRKQVALLARVVDTLSHHHIRTLCVKICIFPSLLSSKQSPGVWSADMENLPCIHSATKVGLLQVVVVFLC